MNSSKPAHTVGLDISKLKFDCDLLDTASERHLSELQVPNEVANSLPLRPGF